MNLQMWDEELEIFDDTQYLSENDESMFHGWMNEPKRLVFIIGSDCTLTTEKDQDGRDIYIIERREKNGKLG